VGIKLRGLVVVGISALLALGSQTAANAKTDLLVDIDSIVVAMHDYSVASALIKTNSAPETIQKISSSLNSKLTDLRKKILILDQHLVKNWTFLGTTSNYTYPARDTMHNFDTQALAWYNYELQTQKSVVDCYKLAKSAKDCVLNIRKNRQKLETSHYNQVAKTLGIIEKWRLSVKR
jgi:hypothetical protein